MSKYTLIVSELKNVNEARFQLICNHYLAREHNAEVKSPGTVVGKEKTRKGKPDAYIRFDDGSYLLAEYTTKEKDENPEAFFKKLEGDLRDCLNFEALHIKPEQVRQIILCCNSAMAPAEEESLHQIAKPYSLRIVDVHALSIFLHLKGKTIAREF